MWRRSGSIPAPIAAWRRCRAPSRAASCARSPPAPRWRARRSDRLGLAPREDVQALTCHPGESRGPQTPASGIWTPAFAGVTTGNWGRCRTSQPSLIHPLLRREALHVVSERLQMHGPVVDARLAVLAAPDDRVLQPVDIVALRIVFARMGAAALRAVNGRIDGDHGLVQQVVEFQRLHKVAVPDQRAVADSEIAASIPALPKLVHT